MEELSIGWRMVSVLFMGWYVGVLFRDWRLSHPAVEQREEY